jgi:hypothetical protein
MQNARKKTWVDTSLGTTNLSNRTNLAQVDSSILTTEGTEKTEGHDYSDSSFAAVPDNFITNKE